MKGRTRDNEATEDSFSKVLIEGNKGLDQG